ncbi:MAG: GNAT family protein [Actinophytocola sp.]|uniref:GNAT family N-acetyltransferase n=1 Tax=Actinophytocola sp. TaxID=1872138 RepID=UPI003C73A193
MEFTRVQRQEADEVVGFLTAEEWPFHTEPKPDGDAVRARVAGGAYDDAFWIADGPDRLGLVRLLDLDDGTPLFDLRVRASARGRGVGATAVRWLTSHVFTNYATNRIEGTTRQDNHAMRRIFSKAGYAKEAHYRDAWPGPDRLYDSVGYATLRRDWETSTVTSVDWPG